MTESGNISGAYAVNFGQATPTYTSFITASPTTIFTNTQLSSITGLMGGGWITGGTATNNGYLYSNSNGTATVEMETLNGSYNKCVKLQLRQSGADIVGYAAYAKYIGNNSLGYNFFNNGGNGGTIATSFGTDGYGAAHTTIAYGPTSTGTVILSGSNSYTGTTTISGAVVHFVNEASLYNDSTASWTAANIDHLEEVGRCQMTCVINGWLNGNIGKRMAIWENQIAATKNTGCRGRSKLGETRVSVGDPTPCRPWV